MSVRQRILIAVTLAGVLLAMVVASYKTVQYVDRRGSTDRKLTAIANYLVDCTTPTPSPTPDDPSPRVHECFERGARGQSGAIVEIDCRSRRQQARLPAPPDPSKPCVDQTPADVYPGVAGQPPRSSP